MVGRFFADHPIPGDTRQWSCSMARSHLTISSRSRRLAPIFVPLSLRTTNSRAGSGALLARDDQRPGPTRWPRSPAVAATTAALGIDAANMRAFTVGCGMELDRSGSPIDADRGTRRTWNAAVAAEYAHLQLRLARYRETLKELGRQLLAARTGMIRINHKSRESWLSVMDWGNHHMGTTRMHTDPRQGVVMRICRSTASQIFMSPEARCFRPMAPRIRP